ncbi:unnamed protein product [Malus baccata var. baccata]
MVTVAAQCVLCKPQFCPPFEATASCSPRRLSIQDYRSVVVFLMVEQSQSCPLSIANPLPSQLNLCYNFASLNKGKQAHQTIIECGLDQNPFLVTKKQSKCMQIVMS